MLFNRKSVAEQPKLEDMPIEDGKFSLGLYFRLKKHGINNYAQLMANGMELFNAQPMLSAQYEHELREALGIEEE